MATTLLLADDSPTIAKILKMALANEPYEIRSVLTAEEALTELKNTPPYVFLVDLSLPEKNGYEFARLIKRDPKLRVVRVVLLASAFEPVDEIEYQSCGADGLIKKPFDPSELRQNLRTVVDAPPQYPLGSQITGSLSGFMVSDSHDATATSLEKSPPTAASPEPAPLSSNENTLSLLLSGGRESAPEVDANSILANLLRGNEPSPAQSEPTNPLVFLDLSNPPASAPNDVLDISDSFDNPSANNAMISAAEAPLSAKAQALAAFFEAELQTATPDEPPSAPPAAGTQSSDDSDFSAADPFDASLSSIEWNASPDANLSGWSSNQPNKTTSGFSPIPASGETPPKTPPRASKPGSGAERGGGNLMFDTGGSSFRFSQDYISRITKAFTGNPDETVTEAHHARHAEPTETQAPFFPQRSDDSPAPSAAPPLSPARVTPPSHSPGGGAWSEHDVQKIEQIVREEVQMVVREVAEKIAWEVIPELAENLIRKELDRVLKEMGQ